jgi:hypothetical protein
MVHKIIGAAWIRIQAYMYRLLAVLGIHLHPRDKDLVDVFGEKRRAFESIRLMLMEDRHLGYVSGERIRVIGEQSWRYEDDPGISQDRWKQYRELFLQTRVVAVSHVSDNITMRVSTRGSSSKGFVWSPAHPVLTSRLEYYPLSPEMHAHIVLDDLWYIYYGWDS